MQKKLEKTKNYASKGKGKCSRENPMKKSDYLSILALAPTISYLLQARKIDDDNDLIQAINGMAMTGSAADSPRQTKVINSCKI